MRTIKDSLSYTELRGNVRTVQNYYLIN